MDVSLLRAIRIVIRADSDPVRQALFANLRQSSLPVRLVYGLHQRLGRNAASSLLVSFYGLAFFLTVAAPRGGRARVLAVARHANARRQVKRVASWIGDDECGSVETTPAALMDVLPSMLGVTVWRAFARSVRIVGAADRRHGFLVACRVSSALGWYARAAAIIRTRRPDAVLVSSDSNPEEVACTAAARAAKVPTVFISHSYPTPFSPPLDFSLSILEGRAEVRARSVRGPIRGEVALAGVEGESAPLDLGRFARPAPVIGLFTPKAINWPHLARLIADCREHCGASRLLIRWHPSMFEAPRLGDVVSDLSGIEETPRTATLTEVARRCDWVIADENSGVHLPVLKLGIPSLAVQQLGLYPPSRADMYGFAAHRVIYPAVASVRDLHPDRLSAFFSDGWAARFEEYDASYLRSPRVVAGEVRHAIARLVKDAPLEGDVCLT